MSLSEPLISLWLLHHFHPRACGQCAAIASDKIRALCILCIQTQPSNPVDNTTQYNIGDCVDLLASNGVAVNKSLTPMEVRDYSCLAAANALHASCRVYLLP
jgi:hypothetical protein